MMKDKKNMGCEELSRRYTAGEMTASEMKSFELHLAGCQACKALIPEWGELFAALSAPTVREPGPDFDRPIMAFVRSIIQSRAEAAARLHGVSASQPAYPQAAQPSWAPAQPAQAAVAQPRSLWAAALRSKLAWASGIGVIAALVFLGVAIRGLTIVLPSGERQYVNAVTWLVDVLGRGFDWLVFQFMRTIKISEVFLQIGRALDPLWNSFRVAARNIDPQFALIQLLLFTLSLVLLRAVVVARAAMGTAQKGRCPNVEIML